MNLRTSEPQPAAAWRPPPCVWPFVSVINDYVLLARQYSEAEDSILMGSFLPVISAVLARNVYINFGGRMFSNFSASWSAQRAFSGVVRFHFVSIVSQP